MDLAGAEMDRPCRAGWDACGRLAVARGSTVAVAGAAGHVDRRLLALFGVGETGTLAPGPLPAFAALQAVEPGCPLWRLAGVLFDERLADDRPQTEAVRMAGLSGWLEQQLPPAGAALAAHPALERLLLHNDLAGAGREAARGGFPRLGVLLALARADPAVRRACFEQQLQAWRPHAQRIPEQVLLAVQVLAGRFERVQALGAGWVFRFALHFWFGLASRPIDRLALALRATAGDADVHLELLRLFFERQYVEEGVPPADAARLFALSGRGACAAAAQSWVLARMLGITRFASALDAQLAEQLEAAAPELAACLLAGPARARLVARHYPRLVRFLDAAAPEMARARAPWLRYTGAPALEQFTAAAAAADWEAACALLANDIGPAAVLCGDERLLHACLGRLPPGLLEAPQRASGDRAVVGVLYGYVSVRMAVQQGAPDVAAVQGALRNVVDNVRAVAGRAPRVQAALAAACEALLALGDARPELAVPSQSLLLASDARLRRAHQLALDLLSP